MLCSVIILEDFKLHSKLSAPQNNLNLIIVEEENQIV